ncbi:MAG: iron-containing alcohol dehydrogenase [Bacteroidales bacterium]|nr:iron-containing alcohol dehydrogenase [Bacteroidales bacterium]
MEIITLRNPARIVFGPKSFNLFIDDCAVAGLKRILIVTIPELLPLLESRLEPPGSAGLTIRFDSSIRQEPSYDDVYRILDEADSFGAEGIVGIGGGSVLDTAKIVAALLGGTQKIHEVVGNNLIHQRSCYLACLPTTSGTGSEVSPNSILIDPVDSGKKGIISPQLVPDYACIDPELTVGVPPAVTASTGMDALTHCIEAYTNRFAHPVTDIHALEGCRLIAGSLKRAVERGGDIEARTHMALGSLYGGMCLGPVNTAAVHALAYPLGSVYRIPHGLSNTIMLPHVMRYNLPGSLKKYEQIALAMGAEKRSDPAETALEGIKIIEQLIRDCNLPVHLSEYGIREQEIDSLVEEALKIQRLLKNNPREITAGAAREIYLGAL